MLLIPDEALDLIAGGYPAASDASNGHGGGDSGGIGGDIPSITISGELPPEEGSGGIGYWPPGWGGGGGGGGGSEGSSGTQPVSTPQPDPAPSCPPVHSSPVPANAPKDVDMNVLRNTMLDVAAYIKTMDSSIEHGAFVVRSADGTFRVGEVKHGTAYNVENIAIYPLKGDVVVAYIHSHPDNGIDQTRPSRDDFTAAKDIRNLPVVDDGMMLYILDNKSGDVFEYHADIPQDTTKSGANITDDTSQPCG